MNTYTVLLFASAKEAAGGAASVTLSSAAPELSVTRVLQALREYKGPGDPSAGRCDFAVPSLASLEEDKGPSVLVVSVFSPAPSWTAVLQPAVLAVNGEYVPHGAAATAMVKPSDEIAVIPPISGG